MSGDGLLDKDPSEMTDQELQEAVQHLEVELARTQLGTRGHARVETTLDLVMAEAQKRSTMGS